MNKNHSVQLFTMYLYKNLSKSKISCNLNPSLFVIWFSRLITHYQSLSKIKNNETIREIEEYVTFKLKKSPSFLWSKSFSSIHDNAVTKQLSTQEVRNLLKLYNKFRTFKNELVHSFQKVYLSVLIFFNVYILNNEIVIFCNRRIDRDSVVNFFSKINNNPRLKRKFYAIKTSNSLTNFFNKPENITSGEINEIKNILGEAYNKSLSNNLASDYDALIPHTDLISAINNSEKYFSTLFNKRKNFLLRKIENMCFPKGKLIIIDDSAEILRNKILFYICQNFAFNLYGCQHGGKYGELRSPYLALETTNAAYDLGYLGWGFGLKIGNFRKKLKKNDSNILGFKNSFGIIYPQSIEAEKLENTLSDITIIDKIEKNKNNIIKCLKRSNLNYWVKPHPKSLSSQKNICNLNEGDLLTGVFKPTFDSKSVQLVIFDAPGQSLMYSCLDQKINFIYCFSLSSYSFTNAGYNYYTNLSKKQLFINADISGYESRLDNAILQYFNKPFTTALYP